MARPRKSDAEKAAGGQFRKNPGRAPKEPDQPQDAAADAQAGRDYPALIDGYIAGVRSGEIVAGRLARAAVERHVRDLERVREPDYPYRFDVDRAGEVLRKMERYPHVKGRWAAKKQLLVFGPWQCFIVACIFGWVRKRDGKRRFREAYVRVARKNGKSVLGAAIGNYMLLEDGEFGAEVYAGATSEKQAWEVFGPAKLMLQRSPKIREEHSVEIWAKAIVKTEDNSKFWPVIGKPGDGPSPSCAIVDEYHEHDTSDLVDTMVTGMGAREQPLLLIITTAGTNLASPCYDKDEEIRKILEGQVEADDIFGIIYSIDLPDPAKKLKGDDWADGAALVKANPNLGVSVDEEFLLAQQRQAVMNPTYQNRFKTKHANVWCNASVAGINMHLWKLAADTGLDIRDFDGQPCWLILDLASKLDVCAFVQLFLKTLNGQRHWYAFGRYYLPEDTIEKDVSPAERVNQEAYRRWVIQHHLLATPGAEIDFELLREDVLRMKSQVQVKEIVYDPWRATQLAHELTKGGATCVEFPQGGQHVAAGFDELNAALAAGRFHHDGSPVLEWMASNTKAKSIAKGLTVPAKDKPTQKIDGIVAICMGLARGIAGTEQPAFQAFVL